MLLDLSELMKPSLNIMDAVMAMEGDGPASGQPRKIGAVIVSDNCHGVDVVEARLMGFDPLDICTIRGAVQRGFLDNDLSDVNVVGARIEELAPPNFKKPSTYTPGQNHEQGRLIRAVGKLARAYALRPELIAEKCVGCGQCEKVCPKKTVMVKRGKARFSYGKCIRCYCCHEMCPHDAIALRKSTGGRMLARMTGGKAR
jgi:ferredoxin